MRATACHSKGNIPFLPLPKADRCHCQLKNVSKYTAQTSGWTFLLTRVASDGAVVSVEIWFPWSWAVQKLGIDGNVKLRENETGTSNWETCCSCKSEVKHNFSANFGPFSFYGSPRSPLEILSPWKYSHPPTAMWPKLFQGFPCSLLLKGAGCDNCKKNMPAKRQSNYVTSGVSYSSYHIHTSSMGFSIAMCLQQVPCSPPRRPTALPASWNLEELKRHDWLERQASALAEDVKNQICAPKLLNRKDQW